MTHKLTLIILLFSIGFISCQKSEGPGGRATIKGKIYVKDYSNSGVFLGEFYGADYDVYIIYGTGSNFYDDRVKTSYDGSYEFRYLRPGTYRVFAYSKDSSVPSGVKEVIQTVEISNKKEVVELADIEIRD